jgi:internalin A
MELLMRLRTATLSWVTVFAAACVVSVALERAAVANDKVDESQAISEIKRLGGSVERDGQSPGYPVIAVDIVRGQVGDSDLHLLRAFKNLKELTLSATKVTDAGLKELRELKNLTSLELHDNRQITGAGLRELRELKSVTSLDVRRSPITDASCQALGELTNLTSLSLAGTRSRAQVSSNSRVSPD